MNDVSPTTMYFVLITFLILSNYSLLLIALDYRFLIKKYKKLFKEQNETIESLYNDLLNFKINNTNGK